MFIPEAVITPVESVYEIAAQGLWGGELVFPEGTQLISGVCLQCEHNVLTGQ